MVVLRRGELDLDLCLWVAVLDKFANLFCSSQVLVKLVDCNSEAYRDFTCGDHPRPKQMAHTSVLLPVPFGPITMFRLGPRWNSAAV
jgi:hypothetical protein